MSPMFVPGPVDVDPAVLTAQAQPMLPHRSEEFETIFHRAEGKARRLFYTQNRVILTACTAAHSLELDDVVNEASLHPGVAIMPAALAAAHIGDCSGKEFIAAITVGYEVMVKLGVALDPAAHYARGFHPTGTCGTMGAAITAAKVLKLNPKSMLNALGIAGSQAAGSMEFLSDGAYQKTASRMGWA